MKYDVEFVLIAIIENSNELKYRQNQLMIVERKVCFVYHETY